MLLSRNLRDCLALSDQEYFPLIARECDQLAELTERISLLFEELPEPKESVVSTVIDQVIARFRNLAPTATVRVDITPDALNLRVKSGKYLAVCLEEILSNAYEAAPVGEILLGGERKSDSLVLWVKDQGPSVKALALDDLFKPFYTTKSRHVGIGLAMAKRLAEALGGKARLSAIPSGGLAVEVELPIRGG
jgi:signal transduction histidine kinase